MPARANPDIRYLLRFKVGFPEFLLNLFIKKLPSIGNYGVFYTYIADKKCFIHILPIKKAWQEDVLDFISELYFTIVKSVKQK